MHLVAFDGSELAAAALRRVVEFAEAAGTDSLPRAWSRPTVPPDR